VSLQATLPLKEALAWKHLPSVGTWLHLPALEEAETPAVEAEAETKSASFTELAASLEEDSLESEADSLESEAEAEPLNVVARACGCGDDSPFGLRELIWYADVPAYRRASALGPVVLRARQNLRRAMERSKVYRKQVARKCWSPGLDSVNEGGSSLFDCDFSDDEAEVVEDVGSVSEFCCVEEGPDLPGVVPTDEVRQVARPLISTSGSYFPQLRTQQLGSGVPPPPPRRSNEPLPPSKPPQAQHAMRRQRLSQEGPSSPERAEHCGAYPASPVAKPVGLSSLPASPVSVRPATAPEQKERWLPAEAVDLVVAASEKDSFAALTSWLVELSMTSLEAVDDADGFSLREQESWSVEEGMHACTA